MARSTTKATGGEKTGDAGAIGRGCDTPEAAIPPLIDNLFRFPVDFLDVLDDIAIGVMIIDLDRKLVALNRTLKAVAGVYQPEVAGVACCHILRCNACLQNCPALAIGDGSASKCVEGNLVNRDRQLTPVRITSAPIRNLDGELIGFLETVEDISLLRKLDETASHTFKFNNIVGRSPQMEKLLHTLPSLAQTDSSILITGETGTGKDMIAESIHHSSNRARGPFVKINCGALPEALLESELFGHRKGAFTGAVENKLGRFRLAHNGTLYLTEIGDLPPALQVKLLTFLDDREVFPLGSVKPVSADVRIIAATHRNLERRLNDRRFRKDLLFRLNVIRLHLPPLRERQGDIQLLVDHFVHTLSIQMGIKKPALSDNAVDHLLSYTYPGNVRELKNIIEYAVNMGDQGTIRSEHLPHYLTDPNRQEAAAGGRAPLYAHAEPSVQREVPRGRFKNWSDIEKQMIVNALVDARGRRNRAAAALGWARSTLWRKMKHYGIT